MRGATAAQLADLAEVNRLEAWRVRIEDNSGTLQDVTDQVIAIPEVTIDVNANARTATVVVQRETSAGSLSPLMSGTPAIYPRREIRIDFAVKRYDETVTSSDWIEVFKGYIDTPQFGGRDGRMVLPCRDDWLYLMNQLIESEATYSGAISTVAQSIVDDNLGSGVYTVNVVGTPTTTLNSFTQRRMKVAEALVDISNYTGWHWRFAESGGSWLLTYEEPPRSETTPDYTFTTKGYFDVPQLAIDPSNIINRCLVKWDATNVEIGNDTTSQASWGELAAFIDASQDPQFTSSTPAQALADVVVADRANPLTLMTVRGRLFPYAEIWDLYRWPADGILYANNLDLAVSKVVHSVPEKGDGPPTTTLHLQGSPSGGVDRWDRLILKTERAQQTTDVSGPIPDPAPEVSISAVFDSAGNLSATLEGSALRVASWKVVGAIGSEPSVATVQAATAIDGTSLTIGDVGTLATATAGGEVGHVAAIGYTSTGGGGASTAAVFRASAVFGTPAAGIPDDSITAAKLTDGAVVASKMSKQAQGYATSLVFSSSAYNNISWGTGTIEFADGTTQAISAGSQTLTLAKPTTYFIYYNGTGTLQVTSTYSSTLGEGNVILCVAQQGSSTSEDQCFYVPAVGALRGGIRITADQVAANAITAAKIDVVSLSAISADVGTLTAGLIQNTAGTTFIDLDATGSGPFIKGGSDFTLTADGSATFGGTVTSSSFTAAEISVGSMRVAYSSQIIFDGGPLYGDQTITNNAGDLVFSGNVTFDEDVALGSSGLDTIAFYGSSGSTKQTVTGSRGGNAALASLLSILDGLGLITDSST